MTQKEKTKVYDKFVEELKSKFKDFQVIIYNKNDLEKFFPELKESEDERIKREIITYLSTAEDKEFIPYESWIAWLEKQKIDKEINLVEILKHYPKETELYSPLYGKLWLAEVDEKNETITCYKHRLEEGCTRAVLEQEDTVSFYSNGTTGLPDFNVSKYCMLFLYDIEKQGEQKPANKVGPKFHEGDWVISNNKTSTYQVIEVKRGIYVIRDNVVNHEYHIGIEECEKSGRLWNISDAKDGDVLFMDNGASNCIFIYKSSNKGIINKYASYNKFGFEGEHYLVLNDGYVIPATKEQKDILEKAMTDAGYTFDFEKKELKKMEQNPADRIEPIFEVGDWIVVNGVNGNPVQITSFEEDKGVGVKVWFSNGTGTYVDFLKGYHKWTIADAKKGDVLACGKCILIFDQLSEFNNEQVLMDICHCTSKGFYWQDTKDRDLWVLDGFKPATKEQRDTLFVKMHEAGYEWDSKKKELKKIEHEPIDCNEEYYNEELKSALFTSLRDAREQYLREKNAAWSEEDEKTLQGIIDEIEANKSDAPEYDIETYDRFLTWLKSLKGRLQPKVE